jgi:CubicO group peptidase (beta-lactamase class C family)
MKQERFFSALLACLVLLGFLQSCTGSFPAAQELNSQADTPGKLSQIDLLCQQAVEQSAIPGIMAFVSRGGKTVYHKAHGMADLQSGREMKTDDIFRIASQSKAITATAVMTLWEQGHFQLDDLISDYIPEFKEPVLLNTFDSSDSSFTTTPALSEITIRQLLSHTSGVGYGGIEGNTTFEMIYEKAGIVTLATTDDLSIEENVKRLASVPLLSNPGEAENYSMGLDILGYLVEIVSGMPFDMYLRTQIFDPLEMDETWFYLPDSLANRLVPVYSKTEEGLWVPCPLDDFDRDFPITGARRLFSGGAGLSSTAEDYATFLEMYLHKGTLKGQQILQSTTVDTIMANQVGSLWGEDPEAFYGLAFMVISEKGGAEWDQGNAGTFSWAGYFNTSYFADPKTQTIGLLFMQSETISGEDDKKTGALHEQFRSLVLSEIEN